MKNFLKWFGISLGALILLAVLAFIYMKNETKKHSPEDRVTYTEGGYDIMIDYSRPFKKDRDIFGGLVPYGEVWRTGANEATTFYTGTALVVGADTLPAGEYTLWTVPNKGTWQVIFNSGEYGWGVGWDEKASRESNKDVLQYTAKVQRTIHVREQFTIDVAQNPPVLTFAWDDIQVDVPMR